MNQTTSLLLSPSSPMKYIAKPKKVLTAFDFFVNDNKDCPEVKNAEEQKRYGILHSMWIEGVKDESVKEMLNSKVEMDKKRYEDEMLVFEKASEYPNKPSRSYTALVSWLMRELVRKVTLHPVKLELMWNEKVGEVCDYYGQFSSEKENEKVFQKVEKEGWNFIPFPKVKKITGFSQNTGITDERGGGCGHMNFKKEDFVWTVETNLEKLSITLKDITEIVYRLKGSKYDYGYEIYMMCNFQFNSDGSECIFEVEFDYGS